MNYSSDKTRGCFTLIGICTLCSLWPYATAHAELTSPTRSSDHQFLTCVDRETYADEVLRNKLDAYLHNVETIFCFTSSVVVVEPFDPKAPGENISSIRRLISDQYHSNHIVGALLIGKVPYMTWRQAAGGTWVNYGTEDFYYADLDAQFLDRETRYGNDNSDIRVPSSATKTNLNNQLVPGREHSADGQYDTYVRGKTDGPAIWVSRVYAPDSSHYHRYFDKLNDYYSLITNRWAADAKSPVTPYRHILYTGHPAFVPSASSDKYKFLKEFNKAIPDSQFVVIGENVGGTVAELFGSYGSRTYLFAEVDGHADPYYHELKGGGYTVRDVQEKLKPGTGALIEALWGCHSGDFRGIKDGRINLTFSYILSPGITQSAYGCSWTSGTEEAEKEILSYMGQGDYLGLAFQKMQKCLYSKSYMEKFFPNEAKYRPNYFLPDNATDEERMQVLMTRLLRGWNLMGNPFLKITYANTAR